MTYLLIGVLLGVLGRSAGLRRDGRLVVLFLAAVTTLWLSDAFDSVVGVVGLVVGSGIGAALVDGRRRLQQH